MASPFPGGPAIDALAATGDPRAIRFPRPRAPGLDFSFSGVKTALLYEVRKRKSISDQARADLAASYQEAIVDALLQRVEGALFPSPARGGGGGAGSGPEPTVVIGGGQGRNPRPPGDPPARARRPPAPATRRPPPLLSDDRAQTRA